MKYCLQNVNTYHRNSCPETNSYCHNTIFSLFDVNDYMKMSKWPASPYKITKCFKGCKKIIFAALVTCPWYCSTQTDRGLQAKHNTLFVLYLHTDKQFFAPVNYNIKKQSQVIDQVSDLGLNHIESLCLRLQCHKQMGTVHFYSVLIKR